MEERSFPKSMAGRIVTVFVLGMLLLTQANAQEVTEDDFKDFAEELRAVSGTLAQEAETREETVERKSRLIRILQTRLDEALGEENPDDKERRVSLFTYELFMAESRLASEQLKLWQLESMMGLMPSLNTPGETSVIQQFLEELVTRQRNMKEALIARSGELSSLITDPLIRPQFEAYVEGIQGDDPN